MLYMKWFRFSVFFRGN